MGYCSNCGEKVPREAMFCSKCGKKVLEGVTQAHTNFDPVNLDSLASKKDTESKVQINSGVSRKLLITVVLAMIVTLIGWGAMSWNSQNQQKKDFISFYKNTQKAMQQLNTITKGIQEDIRIATSNNGSKASTDAFIVNASKSQLELKQIKQELEKMQIPSSFNEGQKSDARGVIQNYINIVEAKIKGIDSLANALNFKQMGKDSIAMQYLEKAKKDIENTDRFNDIANTKLVRLEADFGVTENDLK